MSKIARQIREHIDKACPVFYTDEMLENAIEEALAGRIISRREVEQLRKDVESLKSTLEVVHVNLARAENELATCKVTSDAETNHWFDVAMSAIGIVNTFFQSNHNLRCHLWNTEKELNDLKKSLDAPPAQAAELQWTGEPWAWGGNLNSVTNWTTTSLSEPANLQYVKEEIISVPEESKKSGGSTWLFLSLAGVILVSGFVLLHYLAAMPHFK